MATGVNQEAVANLRKQIAELSHDLVEFRIDHVSTIDYDTLTKLTEHENRLYDLDEELKAFEKPQVRPKKYSSLGRLPWALNYFFRCAAVDKPDNSNSSLWPIGRGLWPARTGSTIWCFNSGE